MRNTGLLLGIFASAALLAACNSITGVDGLIVQADGDGGDGGSTKTHHPTGGSGGATDTGTTSTTTPTPTQEMTDASGVGIKQIALYQGVKATLVDNGADAGNQIPIVANRDAVMRVFLNLDGNYNGQAVLARLSINGVGAPIEVNGPVTGSPADSKLNSTLNFNIPAADIQPGFQYRVELLQPSADSKGPNPAAHYPADGFAATNAKSVGSGIKLVLVPFKYGADGSNRLPDTSNNMINGYKNLFMAMYPTPSVDIQVHAPVQYNNNVSANGTGWEDLLGYLGQIRSNDNAPFDVYYYGIFSPSNSVNNYCGGGCVAGLGNIAGVNDAYSRAAIGLGFSDDGGDIAWETAVHEIGHTHGRQHSPCGGAAGADPNYPHPGAQIGVWGYNPLTKQLFSPTNTTDVMGYCSPIWISDFTWKGIFTRIKAVNGANIVAPPEKMNLMYDRVRVDAEGGLHWLGPVRLQFPPENSPIEVTVDNGAGPETVTGSFYPYDHLPGGVVLWPQAGGPSGGVSFEWQGQVRSLLQ